MGNFFYRVLDDCSWNDLPFCVEIILLLLSIYNCTVYPLFSSLNVVESCKLLVSQPDASSIFFRVWFSETVFSIMSIGDWLFPSHCSLIIPQCIGPEKMSKKASWIYLCHIQDGVMQDMQDIWSQLLKKSLMENFIFSVVISSTFWRNTQFPVDLAIFTEKIWNGSRTLFFVQWS